MVAKFKCPTGSRKCPVTGKCVKRNTEKTARCHKGTRKCANQTCYSTNSKRENAAKKIQKMVRNHKRQINVLEKAASVKPELCLSKEFVNDLEEQNSTMENETAMEEFTTEPIHLVKHSPSPPKPSPKPSRKPSRKSHTQKSKRSAKTKNALVNCPRGTRKCPVTGKCVVRKTEKTPRCHRGTRKCANNVCYSKTEIAAKKIQKMVRNRSRKN